MLHPALKPGQRRSVNIVCLIEYEALGPVGIPTGRFRDALNIRTSYDAAPIDPSRYAPQPDSRGFAMNSKPFGLELKTIDREAAKLDDYFVRSYLAMRFRIGLVAFGLPWVLILIDWKLIDSQLQIRGSMSAYYHSPARDVFVGGLFVTGAFLVSYMRAKRKTYDYWLSSIAGWALIIVALIPTGRALDAPGFKVGTKSCVEFPGPPDCNGFQEALHENTAKLFHGIAATVFVLLLAALCVVFALREFGYGPAAKKLCKSETADVTSVWRALKRHNEVFSPGVGWPRGAVV